MHPYEPFVIKSFKHNGRLHRTWLENWLVPAGDRFPEHRREDMKILINSQTRIREADGQEWISRVPGISFFLPGEWYNVVALIEEGHVRYYCNIASPPYVNGGVLTYIDYDLDVIRLPDGSIQVVDEDEYEEHRRQYQYPDQVDRKVKWGLDQLLYRLRHEWETFREEYIHAYYDQWCNRMPKTDG
jgi:hypothetical protein